MIEIAVKYTCKKDLVEDIKHLKYLVISKGYATLSDLIDYLDVAYVVDCKGNVLAPYLLYADNLCEWRWWPVKDFLKSINSPNYKIRGYSFIFPEPTTFMAPLIFKELNKTEDNRKEYNKNQDACDALDAFFSAYNQKITPSDRKESTKMEKEFDPVKNPSHYVEGRKYEPRKVIADWNLNFNLGNAVKHIARAGKKDNLKGFKEGGIEDLRKAIQYIEFEIEELGGKKDE